MVLYSPDWTNTGFSFILLTVNLFRHSTLTEQGLYGPRREKTCLRGFANNTGADQPAHPRSLISAFVIRVLKVPYLSLLQAKFYFSSYSL